MSSRVFNASKYGINATSIGTCSSVSHFHADFVFSYIWLEFLVFVASYLSIGHL